jgi:hypothetical protein
MMRALSKSDISLFAAQRQAAEIGPIVWNGEKFVGLWCHSRPVRALPFTLEWSDDLRTRYIDQSDKFREDDWHSSLQGKKAEYDSATPASGAE